MAFAWKDYFHLSQILLGYAKNQQARRPDEIREAAFRSVCSRAYYSAYGHSSEYAIVHLGFERSLDIEDQGKDHWRLREHYRQRGHPEIKRKLETLWKLRKHSDYDLPAFNINIKAGNSIQLSGEIIQIIDGL